VPGCAGDERGDQTAVTDRKRILLVSSSGGVLLELLALAPWWSRHDVVWAAVKAADTEPLLEGHRVHWIRDLTAHRPVGLLPGLLRARRILRTERPDLIVSAGSGPAVPYFLAAALADIPAFWVSTHNVLHRPGIAARICARLASCVLLQRPSQRAAHRNGIVIGELY
jgi:UDP-N-acetylglucosamine:LPS N-acetylglucosamine transferase